MPADVDEEPEADEELVDLDDDLDDIEDEDELDADIADDDDDLVDEVLGDEDLVEEVGVVAAATPVVERPATEEAEDEDDEEPEDEDVEASLDVILKERLVVEDEPDDEEPADVEDRSEMSERVLPKQPDEFVCRSCFLVKHPTQLADKKKMLCRDCV